MAECGSADLDASFGTAQLAPAESLTYTNPAHSR